jgi:hypothetical protein
MRPRLSELGLSALGVVLIASASAPAARAQSSAVTNVAGVSSAGNIPATWSTDPGCSAQALRVTFGGNALAIERNGRLIFRGVARLAVSDDEIAVRLGADAVRSDSERNTIRFNRAGDALRLVSIALPGSGPQFPRVPPLYPCRPPGAEASGAVVLPSSATLAAPAR